VDEHQQGEVQPQISGLLAPKIAVDLIEFTGAGAPDPARHAANILVFTKQTRLTMTPSLMSDIAAWPPERIMEELAYMANTIPSSWEFCDYTFLIQNVSRGFTHQFVRTRNASYAQQTMRVLNVSGWNFQTGPTVADSPALDAKYSAAMDAIAASYDELIASGAAIEDARGILPTAIHTNIVAKFNLRTLAETLRKRSSIRTQGEYRTVIHLMAEAVLSVHPWASLFLNRTFDVAAMELQDAIVGSPGLTGEDRTRLMKLIDQMRAAA
jgi:thymidylate synthase (FAD)